MLNSLDLFSGYGGISYGLRDYVKPIGYCEIDNYARAILASRISEGELPFAPIFPDVRELQGEDGCADIITGGFPCQDISVAGLGAGLEGKRSGLFFEIVRLANEIKPAFVFLENVPNIRTKGLRQVVGALTEIGYDCRWTCLSAASVGAPHKRERWFLLAHSNGTKLRNQSNRKSERKSSPIFRNDGSQEFMANPDSLRKLQSKGNEQKLGRRTCDGGEKPSMAHSDGPRLEGLTERKAERVFSSERSKVERRESPVSRREPYSWTTEPNVGRVVNGAPLRVDRIKAIGNGVVPLQVKTAFEKLIGINNGVAETLGMGE